MVLQSQLCKQPSPVQRNGEHGPDLSALHYHPGAIDFTSDTRCSGHIRQCSRTPLADGMLYRGMASSQSAMERSPRSWILLMSALTSSPTYRAGNVALRVQNSSESRVWYRLKLLTRPAGSHTSTSRCGGSPSAATMRRGVNDDSPVTRLLGCWSRCCFRPTHSVHSFGSCPVESSDPHGETLRCNQGCRSRCTCTGIVSLRPEASLKVEVCLPFLYFRKHHISLIQTNSLPFCRSPD